MQGVESGTQNFVGLVEVMEIGAAVIGASVTAAFFVQGPFTGPVLGIADPDHASTGEQLTVSGVTGRQDAVKHVHPAAH